MLRTSVATAAVLAVLLLTQGVSAQVMDAVSVEPANGDVDITVQPDGTVTIPYTVTIGCGQFVGQAQSSFQVTLSTDLPTYYGASSQAVTASAGPTCLTGSGQMRVTANLVLDPTSDAMGRAPSTHTVTASVGSETATYTHQAQTQIDYKPGHTMTPSIMFPYNFTDEDGPVLMFNVTVDISANSQTMVMFEQISGGIGSVNGLFHYIFDVEGGERQKVYAVTWTPPAGSWTNSTISFYNYSHCLKGSPCDPTNEANITWSIVNQATPKGGGDGDKESPSLPFGLLAVGLAALALRRRS